MAKKSTEITEWRTMSPTLSKEMQMCMHAVVSKTSRRMRRKRKSSLEKDDDKAKKPRRQDVEKKESWSLITVIRNSS